jgi:hypothetical protein
MELGGDIFEQHRADGEVSSTPDFATCVEATSCLAAGIVVAAAVIAASDDMSSAVCTPKS